jgi:hypothetical protein
VDAREHDEEERGFEESSSPAQECDGFVDRRKVVRHRWKINKWEG